MTLLTALFHIEKKKETYRRTRRHYKLATKMEISPVKIQKCSKYFVNNAT